MASSIKRSTISPWKYSSEIRSAYQCGGTRSPQPNLRCRGRSRHRRRCGIRITGRRSCSCPSKGQSPRADPHTAYRPLRNISAEFVEIDVLEQLVHDIKINEGADVDIFAVTLMVAAFDRFFVFENSLRNSYCSPSDFPVCQIRTAAVSGVM